MIKMFFESVKISFFGAKAGRPISMQDQAQQIAEKSKALAAEMDAAITRDKVAIVQLMGDFCSALLELEAMQKGHAILSDDIDSLFKNKAAESEVKPRIVQFKAHEDQINQFIGSLNMLLNQVAALRTRHQNHEAAKAQAMMRANVIESRARFSATLERVNGSALGENFLQDAEIREALDRFDSYNTSYEKVFLNGDDLIPEPVAFSQEVESEYAQRMAKFA